MRRKGLLILLVAPLAVNCGHRGAREEVSAAAEPARTCRDFAGPVPEGMPPPLEEPIWIRGEVVRGIVVDSGAGLYDFLRIHIPRGVPRALAGPVDLGIPKTGGAVRDSSLALMSVSEFQPGDWIEAVVYPEFLLTLPGRAFAFLVCRTAPPPPPPPPTTCREIRGVGVPLDLPDSWYPIWVRAEVAAVAIADGQSDDALELRVPPVQPRHAPSGLIRYRVAKEVPVRTAAMDSISLADVQPGDWVLALVYEQQLLSEPGMNRVFALCRQPRDE